MTRRGATGEEVREIQALLVARGYPVALDGDFGPETERAVVAFQLAEGLTADGIVGTRTWRELRESPRANSLPLAPTQAHGVTWRVIEHARLDIGKAEDPPGSNGGPALAALVNGYAGHANGSGWPWCAMAACVWTARALGLGDRGDAIDWSEHPFGAWLGRVEDIRLWAEREGRVIGPTEGAVYVMGRGGSGSDTGPIEAGHCGIVESLDGDVFTCIDGNVSNRVKRMRRRVADVRAFVRWWP